MRPSGNVRVQKAQRIFDAEHPEKRFHTHTFSELVLVLRGEAKHIVGGSSYGRFRVLFRHGLSFHYIQCPGQKDCKDISCRIYRSISLHERLAFQVYQLRKAEKRFM